MWPNILAFTLCLIIQTNVFCYGFEPMLEKHGGTAALHISATDLSSSTQRCGAILISDRHLLTAASCLNGKESERIVSISLGREDLDQNPSPGKDSYNIEDLIIHPDFGKGGNEYSDLAILLTDRKVQYSNKVWPYCLPERNQKFRSFRAVQISGWGYVSQTHKSSTLHSAYVHLMDLPRCVSKWRQVASETFDNIVQSTYPQGLDDRLICAWRLGVDACIGDSGGPMTYQTQQGHHTSIGLIAKRTDCPDTPTTPGFYTNIAHYVDWIYTMTNHSQQSLSSNCGGPPNSASSGQPQGQEAAMVNGQPQGPGGTMGNGQTEGQEVFAGGSGNTPVNVRSSQNGRNMFG